MVRRITKSLRSKASASGVSGPRRIMSWRIVGIASRATRPQWVGSVGDLARAERDLALGADHLLDAVADLQAALDVGGQEAHRDRQLAGAGDVLGLDAELGRRARGRTRGEAGSGCRRRRPCRRPRPLRRGARGGPGSRSRARSPRGSARRRGAQGMRRHTHRARGQGRRDQRSGAREAPDAPWAGGGPRGNSRSPGASLWLLGHTQREVAAVNESIEIAARPAEVWAVIMDPHRLGDWVTAHRKVYDAPSGELSEGDSFKQKLRVVGPSFKVKWIDRRGRRAQPGRLGGQGPGRLGGRRALRALRDGRRRHALRLLQQLRASRRPALAFPRRASRAPPATKQAKATLQNLKELLEK